MTSGPDMSVLWRGTRRREETIEQALTGLLGFHLDVHYIIRDGKVMIVDENTGRVMPDRAWEKGLQQLIEVKENVGISPEKETLARISYQLFFRRYLRLSGMTGTCREVAGELGEAYGLSVVRVHPRKPSLRIKHKSILKADSQARWAAVIEAIDERTRAGQAVLVGTKSILASEHLSSLLAERNIDHQVLNAKQDSAEASLVARAGEAGAVTIATNMAGRGTDIKLSEAVKQAGGLHVILTERHDNARVDRQLVGRCARQGDPGSWQEILSMEDDLLKNYHPAVTKRLKYAMQKHETSNVAQIIGLCWYRMAQLHEEKRQRQARASLLRFDFQNRRALSFSGQME
jgi:preprotein translocase subunit SecA